jgi:hypothetical protein
MAWAEDRAPWRQNPSAGPAAKTEKGQHEAALHLTLGLAIKRQIVLVDLFLNHSLTPEVRISISR